jgi:predicted RNA binding protein YcfA (HicA-like mRNA interferase family)
MPRGDRLLVRCRSGGIISFREFEALLKAFGFRLVRVTGSHRMYWHERASRPLSVQPDGKDAKRYQVRMLLGMIDELSLRPNEDQ